MTYTILAYSSDEEEGGSPDRWLWMTVEYRKLLNHIKSLPEMSNSRRAQQFEMMAIELSKYNCVIIRKQEMGWQNNTYFEFESEADYVHFLLSWG